MQQSHCTMASNRVIGFGCLLAKSARSKKRTQFKMAKSPRGSPQEDLKYVISRDMLTQGGSVEVTFRLLSSSLDILIIISYMLSGHN
ncbi:hypothetical protein HZ326_18098 [Fusarium oxysporum f. sp. albedinis]|nr:hypothetical protein HZ326_18098 [Fusarium oxysporum f. sp. albedinis]